MECKTEPRHLGGLWQEANRINLNPPYQREGGIWSLERQQLFIDSLLNRYDVPKLYFHDLRAKKEPFRWAVIDGKQRLEALWGFFSGKVALADDFEFVGDPLDIADGTKPTKGQKYTDFSDSLKEYFKARSIDVVEVNASDEEEIEELFSRLNNGEPLNAAEKRNAMGGQMARLVRELVAKESFFKEKLGFANKRGAHLEVAAKFVRMEQNFQATKNHWCDLKKKHLDAMVRDGRHMSEADFTGLYKRVSTQMQRLGKIFGAQDYLLGKQSYPQLYYGWVRELESLYAIEHPNKTIHSFLEQFTKARIENNDKAEDERDAVLVEYGRLTQQGTNDLSSMTTRSTTLTRYFLQQHPNTAIRDTKRAFTEDERFVIWVTHGKSCVSCQKELPTLAEMDADHVTAWSNGGPTTLANAQCLCSDCNLKKGAKSGVSM